MRLVCFNDDRIGVLLEDGVHDVSEVVDWRWRGTPYAMNALIERWEHLADAVQRLANASAAVPAADVRVGAPLRRPGHLFAAPLNYRPHVTEMVGSVHAPTELRADHSARNLGFFLKAPGSICGPEDAIELPDLVGREFHHEIELGVVLGRHARAIATEQVPDYVFGYLCLLDITMRAQGDYQEERAMRKSFESFTPIGPCIVTADEIEDPNDLELRLWVNEELRQSANTRDLIVPVGELIASASQVVSLSPGDIYATGTPDGVGAIVVGDTIRASVECMGELTVPVVQRSW